MIYLFSHRKRIAEDGLPDVFTYDELPHELRVQIVHLLRDAIGEKNGPTWQAIHNVIAREHGRLKLSGSRRYRIGCEEYLLESSSVEEALDLVELSFRYVDRGSRNLGGARV